MANLANAVPVPSVTFQKPPCRRLVRIQNSKRNSKMRTTNSRGIRPARSRANSGPPQPAAEELPSSRLGFSPCQAQSDPELSP